MKRDAVLDSGLARRLSTTARRLAIPVVEGLTLCADDFYEGQMRLDGAFCEYTPEAKLAFLHELQRRGVVNIEMEAVGLAAFTHRAGIPGEA